MNNVEKGATLKIKGGKVNLLKKGIITVTTAVGITLLAHSAACLRTDHRHEYCAFNEIFGLKHQANKINGYNGYYAKYYDGETDYDGSVLGLNQTEIINHDGKTYVPFFGGLIEYEPTGKRVEVYITEPFAEERLVRVFRKKY